MAYNYIEEHLNSLQFFMFKIKTIKIILTQHTNKNHNILKFQIFREHRKMDY